MSADVARLFNEAVGAYFDGRYSEAIGLHHYIQGASDGHVGLRLASRTGTARCQRELEGERAAYEALRTLWLEAREAYGTAARLIDGIEDPSYAVRFIVGQLEGIELGVELMEPPEGLWETYRWLAEPVEAYGRDLQMWAPQASAPKELRCYLAHVRARLCRTEGRFDEAIALWRWAAVEHGRRGVAIGHPAARAFAEVALTAEALGRDDEVARIDAIVHHPFFEGAVDRWDKPVFRGLRARRGLDQPPRPGRSTDPVPERVGLDAWQCGLDPKHVRWARLTDALANTPPAVQLTYWLRLAHHFDGSDAQQHCLERANRVAATVPKALLEAYGVPLPVTRETLTSDIRPWARLLSI